MTTLSPDLVLHPLGASERTASSQLTLFHLLVVVIDPYTHESSWILPTALRVLRNFRGADVRTAWMVTSDEYDTRAFLGPLADEFLTFTDRDRTFVDSIGLKKLPALVQVRNDLEIEGKAEGWQPEEWRGVVDKLASVMSWSSVTLPIPGDPVAFEGSPAAG